MTYIYEREAWPRFTWDEKSLAAILAALRLRQGRFLGRMESLGFNAQNQAELESLTREAVKTSEIEGEILPVDKVRSSIARRLGLDFGGLAPSDRRVEGVVEMTLDASRSFAEPLTREKLFRWHEGLFPGAKDLTIGSWRDDAKGPMQVVSGNLAEPKVHYEAPPAERLEGEIARFLEWENSRDSLDPTLKAGIAHLWFVLVHPFDDGNGRIARAIADRGLARSEGGARRFYSMSAQIRLERADYYKILELTGKDGLDVTGWLTWFTACLDHAITSAESAVSAALRKEKFWKENGSAALNARQSLILNLLLEAFEGKLSTQKWAKLAKCSHDTALRDIQDLIARGILVQDPASGRSTSYSLKL